jgi:hypothetical protein
MSARTNSDMSVKGGAHDLALLFVIFCFGALTDMELPAAPDNVEAEQFYQLTKASLTLEPILERPPSVATVQTLSLMAIYEGLCSGENSIESTWTLMGLATKLAQSVAIFLFMSLFIFLILWFARLACVRFSVSACLPEYLYAEFIPH